MTTIIIDPIPNGVVVEAELTTFIFHQINFASPQEAQTIPSIVNFGTETFLPAIEAFAGSVTISDLDTKVITCVDFKNPEYTQEDPVCVNFGIEDVIEIESIGCGHSSNVELYTKVITCVDFNELDEYTQEDPVCVNFGVETNIEVGPINHGHNSNVGLLTDPSAPIESIAYHGQTGSTDLEVISLINPDIIYSGHNSDSDLTNFPPALFDIDSYHGHNSDSELFNLPQFDLDGYSGHNVNSDFTNFPPALLQALGDHGHNLTVDLIESIYFEPVAYSGAYSNFELFIIPGTELEPQAYTGSFSDSSLAVTFALYPLGHSGAHSNTFLSTTDLFEGNIYSGAESTAILTNNPVDNFECDVYFGSTVDYTLSTTNSFRADGYAGSTIDLDFTSVPPENLVADSYHGSVGELVQLDADEFFFKAYSGAYGLLNDIRIGVTFPALGHHGHNGTADYQQTLNLPSEGYHGHNGFCNIFTLPGAEFLPEAYHGHYTDFEFKVPISATLHVNPISAGIACYDGLGGVGGINFCPTYDPNAIELSDNIINPNDYYLDIDFADDTDDSKWSVCNEGGVRTFCELLTRPRFEFDAYHGVETKAFLPKELSFLIHSDAPESRLYHFEYYALFTQPVFDLNPITTGSLALTYDNDEEVHGYYGVNSSVTLTEQPYSQGFSGFEAKCNLSTNVVSYKIANKSMEVGSTVTFELEPHYEARFCKGYILPNGNNVTVDFGIEDYIGCNSYAGFGGSRVEFSLSSSRFLEAETTGGANASVSIDLSPIWSLYGAHGSSAKTFVPAEIAGEAFHGTLVQLEFFVPPIIAFGGATVEVDLAVPGPGVQWVTDEICLSNQYIPLTEEGDLNLEVFSPDVPVEFLEYKHTLFAECVKFSEE